MRHKYNSVAKEKEIPRAKERERQKFLSYAKGVKPRPGSWLRQWRLDHAMSQSDLAAVLGVSYVTILRAEKSDELPMVLVLALEGR